MNKIISWIDKNLLMVLSGFLLVFIPLYPKWPLFDILPGYIVRVRLEDFFVALTLAIFISQFIRKKAAVFPGKPTKLIFIYLIFGFLSFLTAVFVIKTVPLQLIHVGKTMLHWLRRIEYYSLFFVFFASINSIKRVKTLVILFFITFTAIIIYGYGQKYLYWPAFSTMNREFSKGWWLYLTAHARVLSTFGGHYDLAGYLVIALSLAWSFFFGLKNKLAKLFVGLTIAGGFWLLILTASRISFGAYMVGLSIVIFLWMFKKGMGWAISRWLIAVTLSMLIMLSFGDLSDRFLTLIRAEERFGGLRQVLLQPSKAPPANNAVFLENNLAAVTSKSDQPPTPIPSDVNKNAPPLLVPEITASGATQMVQKPRTYSQTAVMFDLSTGIRLDASWPQAIEGFKKDPLLGSGYATLTKTSLYEFTDAESTDNDYLRSLGETGILGFLAFFGVIVTMIWYVFRSLGGIKDNYIYSLAVGFVAFAVGLLVNATLIDIFESSKVAYVFWGMSGLTMGTVYMMRDKIREDWQPLRIMPLASEFAGKVIRFLKTDKLWVALILVAAFWLRTYKLDAPVADWHSWRQADTSAVTRIFIKTGSINWLYPTYEDLSNIASGLDNPAGYRFVEFPIYNAATVYVKKIAPELSVEAAGRVTTILSQVLAILALFLLLRRIINRRVAYISAITYAVLPYTIFYGRTILPDTMMVATSLLALWAAVEYLERKKWRFLVLSLASAAVSMLLKPYAVFLLLPLAYFWFAEFKIRPTKWIILIVYGMLAAAPFALWRIWMTKFPEGIPANSWLFNGNGIRFKGAFWYWLFADRIGRLILGYWGLIPLGIGLLARIKGKYRFFPLVFALGAFLYLAVFATGNVQHDYYQIVIIPALIVPVGIGLDFLLFGKNTEFNGYAAKILAVAVFAFMLSFGWYFVRDYFNINHPEIVEAGQAVDKVAPDKALVVAPYGGDTAFLYQTGRQGWPILEKPIDDLIKMGADYYVSVNFDDLTKKLVSESVTPEQKKFLLARNKPLPPYTLIDKTESFVVIQLVPDSKLPKN